MGEPNNKTIFQQLKQSIMTIAERMYDSGSESSSGGSDTTSSTAAATRGSVWSIGTEEYDDLF